MGQNRSLRAAIVDDDLLHGSNTAAQIDAFGAIHGYSIGTQTFNTGNAFLREATSDPFDIVFMDVYMDDLDGISCSKKLRKSDPACLIVFLTNSSEHMPDAFSCHAFEYIQKPLTEERLHCVLSDAFLVLPDAPRSVEISSGRDRITLQLDAICSVISDAHYLQIETIDGKSFRPRMKLSAFLDLAGKDRRFLSINKGIAVNADHVTGFSNGSCILANGSYLPMRIRDRRHIEETLRNYRFDAIRAQQKRSQ